MSLPSPGAIWGLKDALLPETSGLKETRSQLTIAVTDAEGIVIS